MAMSSSFDKPFQNAAGDRTKGKIIRDHFIAATGEFVGTFFFLYFAFACHIMAFNQADGKAPNGSLASQTVIFISLGYGMSLLVSVWVLYRVSGGLFNPA
jgi:aquaporin related protein